MALWAFPHPQLRAEGWRNWTTSRDFKYRFQISLRLCWTQGKPPSPAPPPAPPAWDLSKWAFLPPEARLSAPLLTLHFPRRSKTQKDSGAVIYAASIEFLLYSKPWSLPSWGETNSKQAETCIWIRRQKKLRNQGRPHWKVTFEWRSKWL